MLFSGPCLVFLSCLNQYASGLGVGSGNGLGLTERDNEEIDSHRHLYVGFHVPKAKRTSEGSKHHHHHGSSKSKHGSLKPPVQNLRPGELATPFKGSLQGISYGIWKFMESVHKFISLPFVKK